MENNKTKTITVSHINIRQSISFMVLKLIVLELIFFFLTIFLCFPLACFDIYINPLAQFFSLHTGLFITLIIVKLLISIYVILDWLDDYYEITPTKIIHKRGTMFKTKEEYTYNHIMSVDINQGIWGKLLNYGTLHMYDRYINKHIYLSFIHNPKRYFNILHSLIPHIDKEEHVVSGHIIENNDEENQV